MVTVYNLNNLCNIDILLGEKSEEKQEIIDKFKLLEKTWVYNNQNYNVIKYDKNYLATDLYNNLGIFRSLVHRNKKILAVSPPKSITYDEFCEKYDIYSCYTEEFIEGTMINLFYDHDNDTWVYSTKSSVGASVYFFNPKANTKTTVETNVETNVESDNSKNKTFGEMFLEVCLASNIDFNIFPKEYCYSFVFQHPENRIVIPIYDMKLYLIKVYHINNETYTITEMNKEAIINNIGGIFIDKFIYLPLKYSIYDIETIKYNVASMNTPYNILGIMIYAPDGTRTKLRNPNYESIRKLRGNQAKLQYQYLVLRQSGKIKDFLLYFPEYKKLFSTYRDQLHKYTDTLFSNYIKCYINKQLELKHFPHEYKTHMFNLHKYYLDELREQKLYINKNVVQNYVNNIQPPLLMYTLNYNLRKQYIDQKLSESICVS